MGKTILIVEDEQNIVDILSFNLSREGYDTLEAYDGPAGLQLALENDPDLILLDLMLPGMDGFEVCRKVRESGSAAPIIMLTAREEEADKVLGLELGADDYITKPFSMRELLAAGEGKIIGVDRTTDGGGSGGGSDGAVPRGGFRRGGFRRGGFRWGGFLNGCAAIDTILFGGGMEHWIQGNDRQQQQRASERMSGIRFMAESSIFRVLRTGYHRFLKQSYRA